jgi:cytidine deaminase
MSHFPSTKGLRSFLASRRTNTWYSPVMKLTPGEIQQLEQAARGAASAAYCPYSNFPVGAAVLTGSGKMYVGCNVENAAFGLCNCAERTALFTAAAAGERQVTAVAIYTPTRTATAPCGACRQVLNEFGADALVISVCDSDERSERRLSDLLPAAFGPANLKPVS